MPHSNILLAMGAAILLMKAWREAAAFLFLPRTALQAREQSLSPVQATHRSRRDPVRSASLGLLDRGAIQKSTSQVHAERTRARIFALGSHVLDPLTCRRGVRILSSSVKLLACVSCQLIVGRVYVNLTATFSR